MKPEKPRAPPQGEVAQQAPAPATPLHVHSCGRLGLTANPPGFRRSFGDWLRRR